MIPAYATPPVFNGNLVAGGKPWFDVTFYGAKGDGSTDDSAAIQAANAAASSACGTLYFPPSANSYKYNSSTTIVIGTCETVYSVGATLQGGALATSDAFQFATGNHPNISVLPNVKGFGGAALHFVPGASQATVYFPSFDSDTIGIEYEGNNSYNTTVWGFGISNTTAAVEVLSHSSSDSLQGHIVDVNFVDCNKYGLYFNTDSGTPINPVSVTLNDFRLHSVDGCNVAGSIGAYAVANFKLNENLLLSDVFFSNFAVAKIQQSGGTTNTGLVYRAFSSALAQQFYGGVEAVAGDLQASWNAGGNGFGAAGGSLVAGFAWNKNLDDEADIYAAKTNPAQIAAFWYWNGTTWVLASHVNPDGSYAGSGFSIGPNGVTSTGHTVCTASSGWPCKGSGACAIASQTTCSFPLTVPASSICTVTSNSNDTSTGIESWKLSLSSTTLTVTGTLATAQSGNLSANITCL